MSSFYDSELDRKSSRGMIYENEELRLRTININAEVERGQSDIKRLRKENDQLRREIWSLRDEYDRLNKRFKTKFVEPDRASYNAHCSQSGCSCQCNDGSGGGCEAGHCKCNSEDSDSCESCCCNEDEDNVCHDECCNETKQMADSPEQQNQLSTGKNPTDTSENVQPGPSILTNFDHLSVVSEETLSNSEVLTQHTDNLLGYTPDISGSQTTLPSLVGPLTPLTPIELVANELNDLQAVVPPLSYFENILQQHMSSNLSSTPGTSSSNSGKTVIRHTNGWDYNLQSPFSQKRYPSNSISPKLQQRSTAQTLTTFVPTTTVTPPPQENSTANGKADLPESAITCHNNPLVETVPITTVPTNGFLKQQTSTTNNNTTVNSSSGNSINGNMKPKHFFAPIKPKLKLNTALANQRRMPPPPPTTGALSTLCNTSTSIFTNGILGTQLQKFEPPDIYVTNALATPYKHPMKPSVQPPPIPQRITTKATTAQVSSPRQRRKSRQHQQLQQEHHPQHRHHYQHQFHSLADHVADANNDACDTATKTVASITTTSATCTTTLCLIAPTNLTTTLTTALLASNILCNSIQATLTTTIATATTGTPTSLASSSLLSDHVDRLPSSLISFNFMYPNINLGKPNQPVYAIAQNVCHNLIIAPAVRQPLMSSIVTCCPSTSTPKKLMTIPIGSLPAASSLHVTASSSIVSKVACCTDIMSIQKSATTPPTSTMTTTSNCLIGDTKCQTDSANLESILNDIEAISEDILAIQLEKSKSRENLDGQSTEIVTKTNVPLQQNCKNSKPYRSEMNLLLTYDGDKSTITQAHPAAEKITNETDTESGTTNGTARRTRSLEREHTDSPSPHIPDPMQPFPDNRRYIGFDRLNTAVAAAAVGTSTAPRVAVTATQTSPLINTPLGSRPHLPLSPLVTNVNNSILANGKPMPPTPPARSYPSPLNIKCAGIQRSASVISKPNTNQSPVGTPVLGGVHPNKSQLFSAVANAAARRAQFQSQPTHLTRSLDTDCLVDESNETDVQIAKDEKEDSENARRKARRVSIVCADTDSPGTPDKPIAATRSLQTQNSTTASCSDLPTVMPNPALRHLKQTSYSTPNSPHSSRKVEGSPLSTPIPSTSHPPTISITPTSPLHQHGRGSHGNGSEHHHSHSNSYPNAVTTVQQQRNNSQDTIKASAAEIACAAANTVRSKCSRRHSDGTVSHTNQRSSGASGGTNGGHHHVHHHHHQHSSSLVSNANPHHSHHSHQDSNHETVASFSDRNSNSLASSRESSASFSIRSARRKLSVSSNTGGKIPWCGCWGNGCL